MQQQFQRTGSNKRPQSINRKDRSQQLKIASQHPQQQQVVHQVAINQNTIQMSNGSTKVVGIVGNGTANSSGLRQVTHPSHAQMLNAIGINNTQGPMIPNAAAQGRNLSVGRQGGSQLQQTQAIGQKTPGNLKSKLVVNQQKYGSVLQGTASAKAGAPPGLIPTYHSNQIQVLNRQASNPRGKSGSRMQQNLTVGTGHSGNPTIGGAAGSGPPSDQKQLKKLSQNLYKNTEQWLNQQMIDSQREIVNGVPTSGSNVNKLGSDQNSAKQLMNDFLNSQQVNGQILNNAGAKANQISAKNNRMLSANKNSSQPGLPSTDSKQRNMNTIEFQTQQSTNQQQIALGPNQQFSFPGTQLLGGTQVVNGISQMAPGQQQPTNHTQPFDMAQVMGGQHGTFNTIQIGQDIAHGQQNQHVLQSKGNNGSRGKNSGSNMRSSQQRRINSTLDNYKTKQGGATGRITQTVVDQANQNLYAAQQQQNLNYQMQTLTQKNASQGRAGSNLRNGGGAKMQTDGLYVKQQLTLTKEQIVNGNGQRAKSTLKDNSSYQQQMMMNTQMNNYLQEHHLMTNQHSIQSNPNGNVQPSINNNNMRQISNQSPLYNQLQMANRFKSKRSESVVTQRPPEISGSKNAIAASHMSRGRNTSLVTGAGPDSIKANQAKGKFVSSGGGPLQYVLPYNKNQSAMTFQSQASGSGYDSQVSMQAQEALNKQVNKGQDMSQVQAGVGIIGQPGGVLPSSAMQHQQMILEQNQLGGDYQNVHPQQLPLQSYTMASRQKAHQVVNTQGMLLANQQPQLQQMNQRVNSSIGKTSSTGEGSSFEKKMSKTPKPGTLRHANPGAGGPIDSQFTSNTNSTNTDKPGTKQTSGSSMHQQVQRAQSRGHNRQIAVIGRTDSTMMGQQPIDNKIVKVQFPNTTGSQLQPNRPKTKSKKGSTVVAQLRDAVNQKPVHLQTQNNGSIAIGQQNNIHYNLQGALPGASNNQSGMRKMPQNTTTNHNLKRKAEQSLRAQGVQSAINNVYNEQQQLMMNQQLHQNNGNYNAIQIDPAIRNLVKEVSDTRGNLAYDLHQNQIVINNQAQQDSHVMLSEEEEEEDEDSEIEPKSIPNNHAATNDYQVGQHLTQNQQLSQNIANALPPQNNTTRAQIFSSSQDEWTDKRIREMQEQMELSRLGIQKPESNKNENDGANTNAKENNMIQYETFESSSGDEMSRCLFESQALSFQNKDKVVSSKEREQKRLERLKRKERKVNEKIKQKKETARQDRKKERLKLQLTDVRPDELDELQDDVLNFKDSERESVLSYFIKHNAEDSNKFLQGVIKQIDTPTRILNKSNDFLGIKYDERLEQAIHELEKKKGEEEKYYKRKRTKSVQLVTPRQEMQQQKDKLAVLIEKLPIESLQKEIQHQIANRRQSNAHHQNTYSQQPRHQPRR